VNQEQSEAVFTPIYIEQDIWERHRNSLRTFEQLVKLFTIKEPNAVK